MRKTPVYPPAGALGERIRFEHSGQLHPQMLWLRQFSVLRGILLLQKFGIERCSQSPVLPIRRGRTLWDMCTERKLESLWNHLFLEAPRIKLPSPIIRKLSHLCIH